MSIHDSLPLLLAWGAGGILGVIFFGGLWWTVRKGVSSTQPALWFAGSLMLRLSVAVAGLYWIGDGHGERLVACLLGFVMARVVVMWRTRPVNAQNNHTTEQAGYAS